MRRIPCVAAALTLAACGSAVTTRSAATATTGSIRSAPAVNRAAAAAAAAPSAVCAATVAGTLGEVAARIYRAAAGGGDVEQAVHRVQSSPSLARAIASDDAAAARSALGALLLGQIVRIEVVHGGRVLASAGAGPAIAPVRGAIPGTGASFVLSVQSDRDYLQVSAQVTGAQVLLLSAGSKGGAPRRLAGTILGPPPAAVGDSGALSYAGRSYEVASIAGTAYPAGAIRIALLAPTSAIACPGSLAKARVEALGHVGELVYEEELQGASVVSTQHRLEGSASFQRAVAERNAAATHAAIVGFFEAHIHVVRVRVTVGEATGAQRLLIDVGGPYVLAPVHGTLRWHGRVVGHFVWAIQDDAGYLKLAHLFTGAQVLMRTRARQVQGTLSPGPASVPDRGEVFYGGRSYQAYSFDAQAFPSGPLRISLLIAA